ncbi:MAG: ATP-binding protein [candidate division WOR-3 bacterium]|nr:ATP-binding protein [candidate division WOR-3 bacterium]
MNSKNYLVVAIILLLLLGVFLIFSIINNQRTMFAFFKEEARSFLSLIALAQENSIFAEAELEDKITGHLLNIVSYLNEIGLRKENLDKIRENFNLNSILVYDTSGRKIIAISGNPYEIDYSGIQTGTKVKYDYFSVLNEKFIRFIYRFERLVFQIELSAEEIKKFSQEYGIGKILNQMVANPIISYVALQDLEGIIFATPNVRLLSRIDSDSSLLKAYQSGEEIVRLTHFENKKVLEIARPFIVEKELVGLLRIGMNLDTYHQYVRSTHIQLILLFLILLSAGIAIFTIFIRHQDYQMREQFFSHLLGSIAEGVLLTDEKGKIKGVNKMFSKISGIPESVMYNQPYEKIFQQDEFSIKLVRETGKAVEEEKEIYQKIIKYATYPLYLSGHKFTGTISIVNDMTEIRAIEKEQQEKERLSFLGNLVANFAHEIKNPLNGLAIAAQRLKMEFPSQDEVYNQLVMAIIKEIDSLNRVVNDFLALARPRIKGMQEFNLSQLIRELGMFIKEQAKSKNVQYREEVDENVMFRGDAGDLRRAVMNLLLNALEAAASVPGSDAEIGIQLKKGRKNIAIRVFDNGPGIPPALLKKIFEPYFTTKKGGTGLGLFIARKIIQDHNGTITVQSSQKKGTVFTIILPL